MQIMRYMAGLGCAGVYLGRILAGRSAHQGEASEGHHAVHEGLARAQRVVEELAHGQREVQAASKDWNHLG